MNSGPIDVSAVLQAMERFDTFFAVSELHALVESLRTCTIGLEVSTAGMSKEGRPIHHVRFGEGSTKALFVGYPHANEPIGGLTVAGLLMLLKDRHPALVGADVEWHVVPCIDPDGGVLNEGWSQHPFDLQRYMKNFHRQQPRDQVECSFPMNYKRIAFDRPTVEAKVLKRILADVRPDFFFSLHNDWAGGAYYCLSRPIGSGYYRELYELLQRHHVPLQSNPRYGEWLEKYADGITELFSMKKFYDFLEKTTPQPENLIDSGACSWDFLADIKPSALTFLMELPYVKHPSDGSTRPTGQHFRKLKLRMDADVKFIATLILEEWENVKSDVDRDSAFYLKTYDGLVAIKERLHDGLPSWPHKTRDILSNPEYGRNMTEGERFNAYMLQKFWQLCHCYEFVRLLKASRQTSAVARAIERMDGAFDDALRDISGNVDMEAFDMIDHDTLAKVQLGSGLIVLNSLLEKRAI